MAFLYQNGIKRVKKEVLIPFDYGIKTNVSKWYTLRDSNPRPTD